MHSFLTRLGMSVPIVQAPMAGVSTPAMAAAASEAGGLGSIGVGAMDAQAARAAIREARARTGRAFNVNLFCHRPAVADAAKEAAWLERLAPVFAGFGAEPPSALREIYTSFVVDEGMLAMLLDEKPAVVSFHFGLPPAGAIGALKAAGMVLLATATHVGELRAIERAGIDGVVAQGFEAGGHRGVFDPDAPDACLGAMALTRLLVASGDLPVIAAGGIMDGAGIAAALRLGAVAAQLGTAFVLTDESLADEGYRAALASGAAQRTVMTRAISGRPARGLANRFTALGEGAAADEVPAYPVAYDAGKALHAAAKATGEFGYGAQWAGQGAPLVRPGLSTAALMRRLIAEIEEA